MTQDSTRTQDDADERETYGLLVVGGGPAALEAARAYRDAGGGGPVHLVSADEHPPYARPPLSKDHLRGETAPEETQLEDASFYRDQGIDLRLGTRVEAIDPDGGRATGQGLDLRFDVAVLATGSDPVPLPVPGGEDPGLFLLRSRRQGEDLRAAVAAEGRRSAVVVGSGFIGCEAAASLAHLGLEVTLVSDESTPQEKRLGSYAAGRIADWLSGAGVRLELGRAVTEFPDATSVRTEDGATHRGDVVLVAAGVQPAAALAEDAGLTCEDGMVVVDSAMRTSHPRVLAAGDVALAHNDAAGRRVAVEHWGDAMTQGEVAGATAAGRTVTWDQAPGFWSEIGDHTLKYSAWGDGWDDVRVDEGGSDAEGAFAVWYLAGDTVVGVLAHERDDAYETGQDLVRRRAGVEELPITGGA
ncbi:NAD(P)/FAD-dependent oxidoreductase [Nocardioidaceae bacterium]|nr:NAD(P)/FAD-dependent oxidoreductase [Nocardioidaceae bacterium]